MAIDNAGVVDFISIDPATDKVVLTIADHLEWDENTDEHSRLLREKLNAYVEFIESGGLLEKYPKAKGREVVINVVGKYPLNEEASVFFQKASSAIERIGASLRFQFGASSDDDDGS